MYTDNNLLMYVLTTAKLNACALCLVGELADFKFTIHYKPGKSHRDTDGFSRMPLDMEKYMSECTEETSQNVIDAAITAVSLQASGDTDWNRSLTDPSQVLDTNKHIPAVQSAHHQRLILLILLLHKPEIKTLVCLSSISEMTQSLQQLNCKATATRLSFLHMNGTN